MYLRSTSVSDLFINSNKKMLSFAVYMRSKSKLMNLSRVLNPPKTVSIERRLKSKAINTILSGTNYT